MESIKTFDELVDFYLRYTFDCFIREGSKGLRSGLWQAMHGTLKWKEHQEELKRRGDKEFYCLLCYNWRPKKTRTSSGACRSCRAIP